MLLVFLGMMGIGLNSAFKNSVLSNAEDALRNQVLLLMANVDVIDDKVMVPEFLSEPRLSQMDSDLFAQIIVNQQVVWLSGSLLEQKIPVLASRLGEFQFSEIDAWQNQPKAFGMTLGVEWETEQGTLPFTVQVAEHATAYTKRLARYQRQVGLWLTVLGGLLVALLFILLHWALQPLGKVTRQVGEIEAGQRQRFDEDYPMEVSRLTQNLNQLLNFEEQRINYQKEVLGNLAHSLKTPIAVLSGLQYNHVDGEVHEQLQSMQTIIDYQLQSASAVGRRRFAKPIEINHATQKIVGSLQKLHKDKSLSVSIDIADGTQFFGDEGDWMELAGNLLDNAFKWATGKVSILVKNIELSGGVSNRQAIQIIVEDDGAGIDDDLRTTILKRGVRLDSQTPGHGLGLHIVKGIVEAYNGELKIEDNQPVGTRFKTLLN